MREMKVSGNPWIKNIPQDWEIIRCKYISSFINGFAFDSKKFELNDYKYPVIRIGDIKDGSVDFYGCQGVNENLGLSSYQIKKDDILLAMSGATVGKVGLVRDDKEAYINQRVGIIRTQNPRYLYYCLSSKEFIEYINLISDGSAQPNVSGDGYGNYEIALPTLKEQEVIAAFLDKKCSEINALTKDIEKQIEVLEDYKKSVITETVTKGLNPNVEMKDSGIQWIASCPKHWSIKKTLYTLKMPITDGPHTTPSLYDTGVPFVSAEAVSIGNGHIDFEHIRGYISEEFYNVCCLKYIPMINDIYMIKSGATTGKVAIVETNDKFTIWSPLAVFRTNENVMNYKFLFYSLQSDYYQKQVENGWTYGTQQNIGMRTLEKLKVCVPPINEQKEIVNYLDGICKEVDGTISDKKKQLEMLSDYKESLIYEYVTGKKEVIA